eukprot:3574864-Amphidinium_carterae.2
MDAENPKPAMILETRQRRSGSHSAQALGLVGQWPNGNSHLMCDLLRIDPNGWARCPLLTVSTANAVNFLQAWSEFNGQVP